MSGQAPKGQVLVVEPSAGQARRLRQAGFEVEAVASEAAALELARPGRFDVLLVDLDTPRVDAASLWRRVQGGGAARTSVWLASRWTNELSIRCAEEGVFQLLQKPADPAEVSRLVAAAVAEGRRAASLLRRLVGPDSHPPRVTARDAKNEFGALLDTATREGAVIITKHEAPRAVLVDFDLLRASARRSEPDLEALGQEFDSLVARMRSPAGKAAARGLFGATARQLGVAAVAAVKKPNG